MPKTILENGIRVYKNCFCECGCGQRLHWSKRHTWIGISQYISGHNPDFIMGKFKKGIENPNYTDGKYVIKNEYKECDGLDKYRKIAIEGSLQRGFPEPFCFNKPFLGCSFHHLNESMGVFVPKDIHESVRHRLTNKKSMKKINKLVFEWCYDNNIELKGIRETQRNLLSFGSD